MKRQGKYTCNLSLKKSFPSWIVADRDGPFPMIMISLFLRAGTGLHLEERNRILIKLINALPRELSFWNVFSIMLFIIVFRMPYMAVFLRHKDSESWK